MKLTTHNISMSNYSGNAVPSINAVSKPIRFVCSSYGKGMKIIDGITYIYRIENCLSPFNGIADRI